MRASLIALIGVIAAVTQQDQRVNVVISVNAIGSPADSAALAAGMVAGLTSDSLIHIVRRPTTISRDSLSKERLEPARYMIFGNMLGRGQRRVVVMRAVQMDNAKILTDSMAVTSDLSIDSTAYRLARRVAQQLTRRGS